MAACRRFRSWLLERGLECPDWIGRWRWRRQPKPRKVVVELKEILNILDVATAHVYLEVPIGLAAFRARVTRAVPRGCRPSTTAAVSHGTA